jgi:hypothetical protein
MGSTAQQEILTHLIFLSELGLRGFKKATICFKNKLIVVEFLK